MEFRHPIITAALIDRALESLPARTRGIHGLPHWLRVERNALYLARQTGGDPAVVSLFALFHDARRYNDGFDPGHGARGARLAEELHADGLLPIGASQLEQLVYAAVNHTEVHFTDDVTVACCWDADRLDLTRLEIDPDPALLNTAPARMLAGSRDYRPLETFVFKRGNGQEE